MASKHIIIANYLVISLNQKCSGIANGIEEYHFYIAM